jgi:hypothetical protein
MPHAIGAASRKVHGDSGSFDLPLVGDRTVEPRYGGSDGNHLVVFTFDPCPAGAPADLLPSFCPAA